MLLVDVNKKVNNKNFTPKVNIDQLSRASLSYLIIFWETCILLLWDSFWDDKFTIKSGPI